MRKSKNPYLNLAEFEIFDSFVFVCYSHKDQKIAEPILEQFAKDGYRFWFDVGAHGGKAWQDTVAEVIEKSTVFLFLASENAVKSTNCKNELFFAAKIGKTIVSVSLSKVEPEKCGGVALQLGSSNPINFYEYEKDELPFFFKTLYNSENMKSCKRSKEEQHEFLKKIGQANTPNSKEFADQEEEKTEGLENMISQSIPEKPPFVGESKFTRGTPEKAKKCIMKSANPYLQTLDTSGDFIFISYSHDDREIMEPIAEKLAKDGYRFWFDAGTEGGGTWQDTVPEKITECTVFLLLITKNMLHSKNCRDELTYAKTEEKTIIPAFLSDINLKEECRAVKFQLGNCNPVNFYEYKEDEKDLLYKKLYNSKNFNACKRSDEEQHEFLKEIGQADDTGGEKSADETKKKNEPKQPTKPVVMNSPVKNTDGGHDDEAYNVSSGKKDSISSDSKKQSENSSAIPVMREKPEKHGNCVNESKSCESTTPENSAENIKKEYSKDTHSHEKQEADDIEFSRLINIINNPPENACEPEETPENDFTPTPPYSNQEKYNERGSYKEGKISIVADDYSKLIFGKLSKILARMSLLGSEAITILLLIGGTASLLFGLILYSIDESGLIFISLSPIYTILLFLQSDIGKDTPVTENMLWGENEVSDKDEFCNEVFYQKIKACESEIEISAIPFYTNVDPRHNGDMSLGFLDRFGKEYFFHGNYLIEKNKLTVYASLVHPAMNNKIQRKSPHDDKENPQIVMTFLVFLKNGGLHFLSKNRTSSAVLKNKQENDNRHFTLQGTATNDCFEELRYISVDCFSDGFATNQKIEFDDFGTPINVAIEYSPKRNLMFFSWTKETRLYNGRMETFSKAGDASFQFVNTAPYGFVLIGDHGKTVYSYQAEADPAFFESDTEK